MARDRRRRNACRDRYGGDRETRTNSHADRDGRDRSNERGSSTISRQAAARRYGIAPDSAAELQRLQRMERSIGARRIRAWSARGVPITNVDPDGATDTEWDPRGTRDPSAAQFSIQRLPDDGVVEDIAAGTDASDHRIRTLVEHLRDRGWSEDAASALARSIVDSYPDRFRVDLPAPDDVTDPGDELAFEKHELRDRAIVEEYADRCSGMLNWISEDGVDQIMELGATDRSPDAPAHLDLDQASELQPWAYTLEGGGVQQQSMWRGWTDDGDSMIVKLGPPVGSNHLLEGPAVVGAIDEALSADASEAIGYPDVYVDEARNAVVMEDVGGENSDATVAFGPDDVASIGEERFRKRDYVDAIAGKVLAGDDDIMANVVTSSDGEFHPIDFDMAGGELEAERSGAAADVDDLYGDADGFWEKTADHANRNVGAFPFEVEAAELRERTEELADEVDLERLEAALADDPTVSEEVAATVVENVRTLRGGER